jgi:uncharacterized protein
MSLQFNVSQLLKGGVGETRTYEFDSPGPLDLDGSEARDITGHVKFTLTNFGILAAAEAHATLELTCARCLEPFDTSADIAFDEEYQPTIDIGTGLPSSTPRNAEAFAITPNHLVDLTEAIRQHLVLAIEIVPLCSPDCKGLCATCGINLNTGTCNCPPQEEPSPFAALQGLLQTSESE